MQVAPSASGDYKPALDAIFTDTLAAFAASMPDYWQTYAAKPKLLSMPEPQFSREARSAQLSGNVLVYLQVDTAGMPTHIRILRPVGLGLDEKAVEAVARYKFKPALQNGTPVTVEMNVEVNFQIY